MSAKYCSVILILTFLIVFTESKPAKNYCSRCKNCLKICFPNGSKCQNHLDCCTNYCHRDGECAFKPFKPFSITYATDELNLDRVNENTDVTDPNWNANK